MILVTAGYVAKANNETMQHLEVCAKAYDELNSTTKDYFSNGKCAVESFIDLLSQKEANITFSKHYHCDENSDFFKTVLRSESPQSFSSIKKLVDHIKHAEWIYSNHYYAYLPCELDGILKVQDRAIKFSVNLGGPGVFIYKGKRFSFSDPKYQDCYDETSC